MKAAGIIINFFFPGIGTLIVGKTGEGITQLVLYIIGVILCFTVVGAIIGVPVCIAVWIWALVSAATVAENPINIVVSNQISSTDYRVDPPSVGTRSIQAPQPAIARSNKSYDVSKWRALVEFDPEISHASRSVASLGQIYEDELAEKYLVLMDKTYLGSIVEKITNKASAAASQMAELTRLSGAEAAQILTRFSEELQRHDNVDGVTGNKVSSVAIYDGQAAAFRGGLQITFSSGTIELRKGSMRRSLITDQDRAGWL